MPSPNAMVTLDTEDILTCLLRDGFYTAQTGLNEPETTRFMLDLARSLGELFVPKDCDPEEPIIRTHPTRSRQAAPFDRSEAIGWHGDFATYDERPELSIVFIARGDPRGKTFGAWRLASVARVIDELQATDSGRAAFELLIRDRLPFSYSEAEAPRWFPVIESRPGPRLGLRFYVPSIRRGCILHYGEIPPNVAAALLAVERAADKAAETVPTPTGSLLIASNWFVLHDRVQQTISRSRPNREALLCFVREVSARTFEGL